MKQRQIIGVMGATINTEGKFLLTRRHAPSRLEWHNKWQFPGGGLDFGEKPNETLKREFMEELNIHVDCIYPHPIVISHVWKAQEDSEHPIDTQVLLLTYITKQIGSDEISIEKDEETNDFAWFTRDEVMELDTLPQVHSTAQKIFALVDANNLVL